MGWPGVVPLIVEGSRLAALGTLRSGGMVANLRCAGGLLGGEWARVPLRPRNRFRRYGTTAWTVRTRRGLDRRDDGRDSCGGAGSGDAAWGAKQGAPASLITAGALLAGVLLLLMTSLNLLVKVGYIPAALFGLFTAEKGQAYLEAWTQWATIHQLWCLIGGFLWLAATVSYARKSTDACLYCGRREGVEGWSSPLPSRSLGTDRLVCGDGATSFLRHRTFRLGIGNSTGDE